MALLSHLVEPIRHRNRNPSLILVSAHCPSHILSARGALGQQDRHFLELLVISEISCLSHPLHLPSANNQAERIHRHASRVRRVACERIGAERLGAYCERVKEAFEAYMQGGWRGVDDEATEATEGEEGEGVGGGEGVGVRVEGVGEADAEGQGEEESGEATTETDGPVKRGASEEEQQQGAQVGDGDQTKFSSKTANASSVPTTPTTLLGADVDHALKVVLEDEDISRGRRMTREGNLHRREKSPSPNPSIQIWSPSPSSSSSPSPTPSLTTGSTGSSPVSPSSQSATSAFMDVGHGETRHTDANADTPNDPFDDIAEVACLGLADPLYSTGLATLRTNSGTGAGTGVGLRLVEGELMRIELDDLAGIDESDEMEMEVDLEPNRVPDLEGDMTRALAQIREGPGEEQSGKESCKGLKEGEMDVDGVSSRWRDSPVWV